MLFLCQCPVCKNRRIASYYCSKACQTKDWATHKSLHAELLGDEVKRGVKPEDESDDPEMRHEANFRNSNGMTLLMASCYEGNFKEVKRLTSLYPTAIFEADKQGLSALWFA